MNAPGRRSQQTIEQTAHNPHDLTAPVAPIFLQPSQPNKSVYPYTKLPLHRQEKLIRNRVGIRRSVEVGPPSTEPTGSAAPGRCTLCTLSAPDLRIAVLVDKLTVVRAAPPRGSRDAHWIQSLGRRRDRLNDGILVREQQRIVDVMHKQDRQNTHVGISFVRSR